MQLTAVAKKGIAKEHAKWSPVAVATFKFEPVIEINEEREALLSPDQKAEFVEICPAKVGCVVVGRGGYRAVPTSRRFCSETFREIRPGESIFHGKEAAWK